MENRKALRIFVILLLVYLIFWYTEFPCPFRYVTGIPCPACGAAHALNDLLSGNVSMSFRRNPLAVPLALLFAYALATELFMKDGEKRKMRDRILIIGGSAVVLLHVLRVYWM